jgi:hypothetical protein
MEIMRKKRFWIKLKKMKINSQEIMIKFYKSNLKIQLVKIIFRNYNYSRHKKKINKNKL